MPPPEGQSFGKYQLLERLAVGGMAEIWRARLQVAAGISKSVVIKKVLPAYAGDPDFIAMFVHEAAVTVGLSHGNIAQVFDFGEVDGEYFLAMEHVHGQSLHEVLARARERGFGVLPTPLALLIGVEMARGLHYAHTRLGEDGRPLHLIHRDVSPQNVVLSYEGQVKLVDFGIAKARTAGRQTTRAGAVKGKYAYFAPEQVRGEPVDARVDVFATGVVLYELLCGQLPFTGGAVEAMRRIARGQLEPPRRLNPDLSPALERVLLKALATEREQRYPSAQALQEALIAELYTHVPPLPPDALGMLMGALFEPELVAGGRPVQLTRDFLALLERTRRAAPAGGSTPPLPEALPPASSGAAGGRRWPPALLAVPLGAALAGGVAVVGLLLPRSTEVCLTSSPAGATVVVDGSQAPTPTPVLIQQLRADRPHRLEVRAPGRVPWVRELPPTHEARLSFHAVLPPLLPDEAHHPTPPFLVAAGQHVLRVASGPTVRLPLEPGHRYQARLEPDGAQALFLLEGAPQVPTGERFGVLGPRPVRLEGAPAVVLLPVSAGAGQGPVQVRLEDEAGAVRLHPLEAPAPAGGLPGDGFRLGGLHPEARYLVTARQEGAPTRPPGGHCRRLLVFSGQEGAPATARLVAVGEPVSLTGASWARFAFPEGEAADGGCILRVEVREATTTVGVRP